jgi:hypothetical protein
MSKKVVIPKSSLNNIIAGQSIVYVRYRLVSEDRNRVSAWTPIFSIIPTSVYISDEASIKSLILGLA